MTEACSSGQSLGYAVNHDISPAARVFLIFLRLLPFPAPMRKRDATELPAPNTRRWTSRRKAAVIEALRRGAPSSKRSTSLACALRVCRFTETRTIYSELASG